MNPFEHDAPPSNREILRDLWHGMGEVRAQVTKTNGRVTKLERFMWLCIGGLTVITAIVVPLFLDVVRSG